MIYHEHLCGPHTASDYSNFCSRGHRQSASVPSIRRETKKCASRSEQPAHRPSHSSVFCYLTHLAKQMRAIVQRVLSASVEVDGHTISDIGPGLLVLVGLHEADLESDADYICRKVLNMRLFPNEKSGKAWDQNVMQRNFGVLLVSQFTLFGILKGNKPDFHVAMPPQKAKPFYDSLVDKFRKSYNADSIKDGVFGAMMKVHLVNDGPVTMQLDSSHSQPSKNNTSVAVEEASEP